MDACDGKPLKSDENAVEVMLIGRPSIACSSIGGQFSTRFAHLEPAATALENGALSPALIVVVQDWPGQISTSEIERLRRAAPLARICGLMGSWCEGETRSGKPWPGAIRCYWHQWPARFQQEIVALAKGENSVWSLPPTASAEERLLAAVPFHPPKQHGLLAIIAENAETADALSDVAQVRGYETAALRSPRGVRVSGALAALWDARPEIIADPESVSQVRRAVEGAPLIGLTSFPRTDHAIDATAAGVAAIVSKPFLLKDLFWQVEQLAFPARQSKPD